MINDLTTFAINGVDCPLVYIAPGAFRIGEGQGAHDVSFSNGYYIGKYPVTQAIWKAVMGKDSKSSFKGDDRPIESVSWEDICSENGFLEKLNALPAVEALNNKDGKRFNLPSETMWEYAARGGSHWRDGFVYAGSNKLKEVGWYWPQAHGETKPVGMKLPNQIGLYDMSGNVDEWCADHWQWNCEGVPEDGSPWVKGGDPLRRVVRGGSWDNFDLICRVSSRYWFTTDYKIYFIGFRLARY